MFAVVLWFLCQFLSLLCLSLFDTFHHVASRRHAVICMGTSSQDSSSLVLELVSIDCITLIASDFLRFPWLVVLFNTTENGYLQARRPAAFTKWSLQSLVHGIYSQVFSSLFYAPK